MINRLLSIIGSWTTDSKGWIYVLIFVLAVFVLVTLLSSQVLCSLNKLYVLDRIILGACVLTGIILLHSHCGDMLLLHPEPEFTNWKFQLPCELTRYPQQSLCTNPANNFAAHHFLSISGGSDSRQHATL